MRIAVVGAGGVGGLLAGGVGGLLAGVLRRADVDVHVLVTERHLEPIRRDGLTVIGPGGRFNVQIQAEVDPRAVGACEERERVSRHLLPRSAECSLFPC
jgi:ketopantoate reductase